MSTQVFSVFVSAQAHTIEAFAVLRVMEKFTDKHQVDNQSEQF